MYPHYSSVIGKNDKKGSNCHACIEVCPVKFCLDGSGPTIKINHELCIGCGRHIDAYSHHARYSIDDGNRFFEDLRNGTEMVAIIAPAAAAEFGGQIGILVGYLHSRGVKAVYDASFGAELTTESCRPKTVIAQPCPAIVLYIELYHPELLEYLSNIEDLRKRGQTSDAFASEPFDGLDAERGGGYPLPGGLMRTVARDASEKANRIRTIEGPENVYPYFESHAKSVSLGVAPLVVD